MSVEVKLPELGENVETGEVVKSLVHVGDSIEINQPLCELETEKAVVEIPSSESGKVLQVHFKPGDTIRVGQTLLTVEPSETKPKTSPQPKTEVKNQSGETPKTPKTAKTTKTPETAKTTETDTPIPAGPETRRLARELGVDLDRLQGSGKMGRITPDDVRRAATPDDAIMSDSTSEDAWGPVRRERMSKIRRTIAAQMIRSTETIPHVTNFDDADVTELDVLRRSIPKGYLDPGVKLTTMPFVLKAVALSLLRHPLFNASLDDKTDEIVYKQYVHLGIAVDTPRGLVVPKIRNVDRLTIPEIARKLVTLADRARNAKFSLDDLRGGTFTVSNLGAIGGTYSTPIINHPESAVLLLGRSRRMPVVRGESIEKRLLMPVSLSYDHRLIDGAAAARFLNEVIDFLQSPGKLLLG